MPKLPPDHVASGHLDMTLRQLIVHMLDHNLDHAVLVLDEAAPCICVTITPVDKADLVTTAITRVLRGNHG